MLELGLDPLLVNGTRELERAREAAVASLDHVIASLLGIAGRTLLLATNRQHAVLRRYFDFARLDARQLDLEHDLLAILAYVDGRRPPAPSRVSTEGVFE